MLRIVRLVTSSYQTQQRRLPGAERDERNEIARDLHDGVTQSLIAAEMHVDALRRRGVVAGIPAAAEEILVQTQELLRREVRKLRMQIEGLRSTSNSLMVCEQLADVIQSFESETGIRTNFICDSKRADISAQSAHDLVHIVQEALSNIRKHSGATKV
ncbi:MAG: histidine kinase, partial [Silvibacterium sp.]